MPGEEAGVPCLGQGWDSSPCLDFQPLARSHFYLGTAKPTDVDNSNETMPKMSSSFSWDTCPKMSSYVTITAVLL